MKYTVRGVEPLIAFSELIKPCMAKYGVRCFVANSCYRQDDPQPGPSSMTLQIGLADLMLTRQDVEGNELLMKVLELFELQRQRDDSK